MKICERCKVEPARKKERFCKPCRYTILAEMENTGYFTPTENNNLSESVSNELPSVKEMFFEMKETGLIPDIDLEEQI